MKATEIFKNIGNGLKARKSTILTAVGITAMLTGTVLAVKATPKAMKAKEKAEKEKGEKLTVGETVKTCWRFYIPAGLASIGGAGAIIGSDISDASEKVSLTSALLMSETARTKLEEKAVEVVGEKKVQAIKDEVNKDIMKENPVNSNSVIITARGNTLVMDSISHKYYRVDVDFIKKQVPEFNMCMSNWRRGDGKLSLNDWYDMINFEHLERGVGDKMGWDSNKSYMDIFFTADIADNGEPCLVLGYSNPPEYIG